MTHTMTPRAPQAWAAHWERYKDARRVRDNLARLLRSLRAIHGSTLVRHWWLTGKITSRGVPANPGRNKRLYCEFCPGTDGAGCVVCGT